MQSLACNYAHGHWSLTRTTFLFTPFLERPQFSIELETGPEEDKDSGFPGSYVNFVKGGQSVLGQ